MYDSTGWFLLSNLALPIFVTPPPERLQYCNILTQGLLLVNLLHGLRNTCTIQMVLEPNGYCLSHAAV